MISSDVVILLTLRNQNLIDHIRTYNPDIAYFLQRLDNNFENILILTCKLFQSKIGIYRKKTSNS